MEMNDFLLDPQVQLAMDWGKDRNLFNILDIKETRHSKMLAWLLDPREGHLQEDYFLKALLREVFINKEDVNTTFSKKWSPEDIQNFSFNNAIVFTELSIGKESSRKIDIAIIDPVQETAIFIENKTGSNEGKGQTHEYFKHLSNKYDGFDQLFIFMDWNEKSAQDAEHWVNVSYSWLATAIENRLSQCRLTDDINFILKQYLEYINDDYPSNCFFKQPYQKLPEVVKNHKKFLDNLKEKVSNIDFDSTNLIDLIENDKSILIYKQYEYFFDDLFEMSEFEHLVIQASNALGVSVSLTPDYRENRFYIHSDEWEKYYTQDKDNWGIQFYIEKAKNRNDELNNSLPSEYYNTYIKVMTGSFKKPDIAKKVALKKQKNLSHNGKKNIYIASEENVKEEQLVDKIKRYHFIIQNFLRKYEKKCKHKEG